MKHRILFIVFLSLMNTFLFSHDKNVLSRSVQAPNAVYNLELGANIKSVHELNCAGMQSGANFNVKNTGKIPFKGYFIVALTDENNNFKYDLSGGGDKVRTIRPNSYLSYKSIGVYVPTNIIPGTYRLRIMYRENASNPWKAVANGSFSSIQTVKIANCSEKKYNLELGANIKSDSELTCAGMQSGANFNVKNTGNASFSGYFIIALTDTNDNFKYVLMGDAIGIAKTIAANSGDSRSGGIQVPADMIPGTYRVRMMYRENASNPWKAVANGAFTSIQTVNIKGSCYEEKYNLELGANIKSDSELTCAGMQSGANFNVKNTGNASFSGYFIIALTDTNDNFKYVLMGDAIGIAKTIAANSGDSRSGGIQVPADMIPGTYRVRMMYRENASNPWKAVANGAFTSIQTVNIKGSCYEEKYNLELGANIKSDSELTCAGMQSGANFNVKNTGNASFSGYFIIALTDTNDNFKYVLMGDAIGIAKTIAANSGDSRSGGIQVPADMIPGTYRVRMMYRENASNPWKAVANGAFTSIQTVNIKGSCYEKKYNLIFNRILKTSLTYAKPGGSFQTKVDIKNAGIENFEGYYTVALTDDADNVKYILTTSLSNTLTRITPGRNYPKDNRCIIPADALPGTYRLRVMFKEKGSSAWKPVSSGVSPYVIPFNIAGNLITKSTTNDIKGDTDKLSIYPNPVTDIVYISSKEADIKEITLFNFTGKVVAKDTVMGKTINIPMQHLSSGIYILKVETTNGSYTHRIIKQ